MQTIVDVHYPGLQQQLVSQALEVFFAIREMPGLKKSPPPQLLDWLKLLGSEGIDSAQLAAQHQCQPATTGRCLLKNEQDLSLFERLAIWPPAPWLTSMLLHSVTRCGCRARARTRWMPTCATCKACKPCWAAVTPAGTGRRHPQGHGHPARARLGSRSLARKLSSWRQFYDWLLQKQAMDQSLPGLRTQAGQTLKALPVDGTAALLEHIPP
jgi:hypothetical protein